MNKVCEILGIKYPVIQGPMAWITSSELVAAVSNAGGLGVLGTSADSTEIVRGIDESVEEMRKAIRNHNHPSNGWFALGLKATVTCPRLKARAFTMFKPYCVCRFGIPLKGFI